MKKGIASDAGHGGHDAGAINGATGHRESDIVLDFSDRFCTAFQNLTGLTPTKTRAHDVFVTLSDRARIANDADLPLISWHCNAFNSAAKGVEAFTSPGQTASDPLATAMLQAYIAANPNVTPRLDRSDGDPDKEARFTVLTKTRNPAVLFELGFIDSPHDIKFLADPKWRQKNAEIQAHAVAKHLGLLTNTPAPEPQTPPIELPGGLLTSPNLPEIRKHFKSLQWQVNKLRDLLQITS